MPKSTPTASPLSATTPATLPPGAELVLASRSPRRSQILSEAGMRFHVQPSSIDEKSCAGESPDAMADRLAREKAIDVASRLELATPVPVLGADTIVVAGSRVLGKPRDENHAVELLSQLMGTTHRVMTGIALAWSDGRDVLSQVVTSEVEMRPATREELAEYVAVGESLDKAGGYALQGAGRRFVIAVHGSSTNVIGLPIEEALALLERGGVRAPASDPGARS